MKEKKKKPKKENKRKGRSKKKAALQAFLGLSDFTDYGLKAGGGTYLFFRVSPTNISVLSRESVEIRERHLMMVLSALPDIRILCMDAAELVCNLRQTTAMPLSDLQKEAVSIRY